MPDLRNTIVSLLPDRVIQVLSQAKASLRNRRAGRLYQPEIERIFPNAVSHELLVANDDAAVFRVHTSATEQTILKFAGTPTADGLLEAESAALDELQAFETLGDWRSMIAAVEARGEHHDGTWFTQTALPGIASSHAGASHELLVASVLAALHPMHAATAQSVVGTDDVLTRLVSEPIALVKQWRPDAVDALSTIDHELRRHLAGRQLSLSRMHGDFAPTNVLWDPATEQVTGIVDWKFGTELIPPEIDLVHFPLSLIMANRRTEYGTTVIRLLDDTSSTDRQLVTQALDAGPNAFDLDTAVALAWLQHVAFGLHKAPDLRVNPIWLNNNIDTVIARLARP